MSGFDLQGTGVEQEQQRGYNDGYYGRDLHPPMGGPPKLRDAYQEGHMRGLRDGRRDALAATGERV